MTRTQHGEDAYVQMTRYIQRAVAEHVPCGATVLIISKGDPYLLELDGRTGWHFPQLADGSYAGFYPSCSLTAIAQLETLRCKGANHLLVPSTAFWWRQSYPELFRHIEQRYYQIPLGDENCQIFSLREAAPWSSLAAAIDECRCILNREPVILDWNTSLRLTSVFPNAVVSPPSSGVTLPYLDRTIDIVLYKATDESSRTEARRVASMATVETDRVDGRPVFNLDWQVPEDAARQPRVSIIVGSDTSDERLNVLLETLPGTFRGEVIIASDGRQTPCLTSVVADNRKSNVVIREVGRNFNGLTHAVAAATGDIVVFLGSGVRPMPGWLPPLLQSFSRNPNTGAVGGKLLREDYVVYEAGGLIRADGTIVRLGQGDFEADGIPYSYVRTVDFCSGVLATRGSLLREVGDFGNAREEGTNEITYCSAIRSKGFGVYYQPESCFVMDDVGLKQS